MSQHLFEGVRDRPEDHPGGGRLLVACVWALAAGVHLATMGLIAGAALLATSALAVWIRIPLCMFLVVVAVFVRPVFRRRPPQATISRSQAPQLFSVIDRIADKIGAPKAEAVRITTSFSASYLHTGRRQRTIGIGLLLWSILEPQERVAVLGHELGHAVSGDLKRTVFVSRSMITLAAWAVLFRPSQATAAARFRRRRSRYPVRSTDRLGTTHVAELVIPIVFLPAAVLIGSIGGLLTLLTNRFNQRCEYRADHLAARAAGTGATVGSIEKTLLAGFCQRAVAKSVQFAPQTDPWQAVAERVRAIPPTEWERMRRLARRSLARIDDSHPPTELRVDMLKARPRRDVAVLLAPIESEAIDRELAGVAARGAATLRDWLGVVP